IAVVVEAAAPTATLRRCIARRLWRRGLGRAAGRRRRCPGPPTTASSGPRAASDAGPGYARVIGPEKSSPTELRGDERVNRAGISPVGGEANPADLDTRESLGELRPRVTGVGGLVQAALRPAANQLADCAPALAGPSVDT